MKQICLLLLLSIFISNLRAQQSIKELPGGPENAPAVAVLGADGKSVQLIYNGAVILEGNFKSKTTVSSKVEGEKIIEQRIQLKFEDLITIRAKVNGSPEALAAETRGVAQENFPLVRTSHGLSNNLRNNAVLLHRFYTYLLI